MDQKERMEKSGLVPWKPSRVSGELFSGNTTGKNLITEYRGNMFFSYYNGRLIESSQFQFSNGQITHYMLSGSAAGSRVVMNCTLQGNRLVTQVPGSTAAVWIRQ
jgi:hypothetical protein